MDSNTHVKDTISVRHRLDDATHFVVHLVNPCEGGSSIARGSHILPVTSIVLSIPLFRIPFP